MKKIILVIIVLLTILNLSASIKNKFPVKNLYDILNLERTIKPEITDNTNSILVELWQVEIFNKHYILLDRLTSKKVNVFDKNGKYIKTLNKVGEGPGEFGEPVFFLAENKKRFYLYGVFPEKIIYFNEHFKYAGENKGYKNTKFSPRFACRYKNKEIYLSNISIPTGKNIFVVDIDNNKIINFRKMSKYERELAIEYNDIVMVKDKLWVTRKFDPFIDIFDINTGKLVKTIGFKDRDYCFYSNQMGKIKKKDTWGNAKMYFKKTKRKATPDSIINIDDKIVLHGIFERFKGDKCYRYFDVYSPEGDIIQEQVLLPQNKKKEEYFFHIPKTNSKKLFLVNINLTEEEEEDFSSIIYQYGIKE